MRLDPKIFRLDHVHKDAAGLATICCYKLSAGGNSVGETPVPIPNTAVKPYRVDGTAWETVWESRSLPVLNESLPFSRTGGFFVLASDDPIPYNPID